MKCGICGGLSIEVAYSGHIREGRPRELSDKPEIIWGCKGCGVQFLGESLKHEDYRDETYRARVGNDAIPQTEAVSGGVVIDVGAGDGALLSRCDGTRIAVEPNLENQKALRQAGFKVYAGLDECLVDWKGKADIVLSMTVIEHVTDPVALVRGMADLLSDKGKLFLTTPNRAGILMRLVPLEYARFFYRRAHRWYFDKASLEWCVLFAGLDVAVRTEERYGFSNLVNWLRDGVCGKHGLNLRYESQFDFAYQRFLNDNELGDVLYAVGRKRVIQ